MATFTSIAEFTANARAGLDAAARGLEDHAETGVGEVISDVLAQVNADNPACRIYTQILGASALRAVESLSIRPRAPLCGLPIVIKDNIDLQGADTSCGRRLAIRPASASAAIALRLVALGAIIIGKTNLDEAALGASGRNPRFGRCHNPRFADRLSGGSSSGSAAAVAAGHALLGVGTDTLGSVRIPAAFCGIAGFKPSHGRLSTAGVAPLYPRFDTVGLLAGSLADIAQVARPLLGEDPSHGASHVGAPRLGMLDDAALAEVESGVARAYRRCGELLRGSPEFQSGAVPLIDWAATAHAAVWEVAHDFAKCSATHAPGYHALDDIEGELARFLRRAGQRPATQLAAGRALLAESARRLKQALEQADAVLTPTCPQSAPRIDAAIRKNIAAFVAPANVAGLPAVAWTQRLGAARVSLQLIGRFGEDLRLLELASRVHRILDREFAIEAPSMI